MLNFSVLENVCQSNIALKNMTQFEKHLQPITSDKCDSKIGAKPLAAYTSRELIFCMVLRRHGERLVNLFRVASTFRSL